MSIVTNDQAIYRPTYAKIHLDHLRENYLNICHLIPEKHIFAVIKANAYGHGAGVVAKELSKQRQIEGFCVALLEEACALREEDIQNLILVLGIIPPQYIHIAVNNHISLTAPSLLWLKEVYDSYKQQKLTKKLHIHLKLDTGMNRIGIKTQKECFDILKFLKDHNDVFYLEGIFTHFASSGSKDEHYYQYQISYFEYLLSVFSNETIPYIHVENTGAVLWQDNQLSNTVRLGIGLYGLSPEGDKRSLPVELKPVLSLESELNMIKYVKPGECIGYDSTYITEQYEWIGTVPIGYADGIRRSLQGAEVIVAGQKVPIVGRICMDQLMVKLPQEYPVGTKVIFIGAEEECVNSIDELANYAQTISYELLCGITDRVPRIYINGEV